MVTSDYALKCEWNYLPMRKRDVQGDGFSVAELKKAAERNNPVTVIRKECEPNGGKEQSVSESMGEFCLPDF